ncbi:holo-[acyl-carrier-protein] synthase [Desulfovibrio inopinatus]|uniref:holo-[acyl-carrier-protein] synthase n=1 Tax=Desulfovibrio inopinatus TaxID=102109 RepID=UPI0003F4B646|nr:holo-[acyl-carrier-protein] synthase [Desulfovibrio inopinatus]
MIVGLGIDIVELDRIRTALERHGERFLEKILTPEECHHLAKQAIPSISARFAAKEAAAKAFGTGFTGGIGFHSFIVRSAPSGRPFLTLAGQAEVLAQKMGVTSIHLSLTHGRDTAAAVVILENNTPVNEKQAETP